MNHKQAQLLNGLALAYMGDAIYELMIRKYLLLQGTTTPNQLHKKATTYVSATAQASIIMALMDAKLLTEEEYLYFKRGRNAKPKTKAKNASHQAYAYATGFEAVIGYVYLTDQSERLRELVELSIRIVEERGR